MSLAALFAAFLASSAIDLGPVPAELEADRLLAEPSLGVYVAEGHALLRRGGLTVFADRMLLDKRSGTVVAEGHVVAVDGSAVLSCERVVLGVPELDGAIERAELVLKRGKPSLASAEAARTSGEDLMRLDALKVERAGARRFVVEDAHFTPCRCAPGVAPDWKLGAASADVEVDSGAWLLAPVLYVKDVPVFILPALYVPLGERRTGLLLPRVGYAATTGVQLTQPLYLTLGRSADLTADLAWWIDRGPAPGLELRWAPALGHEGYLRGKVLLDLGERVGTGYSPSASQILPRFAITGRHRGRSGELTIGADLNVAGDLGFIGEFGVELFEREAEEAVSRVTLSRDFGPTLRVSGGVALRQDLRAASYPAGEARRVALFDRALDVPYRFAELRMDALPYPLLDGPVAPLASARLAIDAISPFSVGERTAGRVDLRPAISLPLHLPGLSLTAEAALRLTGASESFGGARETRGRVAPIFRSTGMLELHRRFGALTHVLRPRLTHLAIPAVEGPELLGADDELGRLGVAHQLLAELESELFLAGSPRRLAWLDARYAQDLRALDARYVLLRAALDLPTEGWTATLSARGELSLADARLDELRATAVVGRPGLGSLSATFAELGDRPPVASRLDPEELVHVDALDPLRWTAFRGVVSAIQLIPFDALRVDASVAIDALAADPLRLVRGGLRFVSPCECWSATVVVQKARDRDRPDFQLAFDLAQVGGTGF